jgi:inorganic pyrophosphatase
MQVFIENQAGSRRKNIYDERTLRHLRTVDVSASYPYPYGFVIGTVSGDADAVDCFVLTSEPLIAGTTWNAIRSGCWSRSRRRDRP